MISSKMAWLALSCLICENAEAVKRRILCQTGRNTGMLVIRTHISIVWWWQWTICSMDIICRMGQTNQVRAQMVMKISWACVISSYARCNVCPFPRFIFQGRHEGNSCPPIGWAATRLHVPVAASLLKLPGLTSWMPLMSKSGSKLFIYSKVGNNQEIQHDFRWFSMIHVFLFWDILFFTFHRTFEV